MPSSNGTSICIMSTKECVKQTHIGKLLLVTWRWYKEEKIVFSHRLETWHTYRANRSASKQNRIFYCGICETSNMGDIAQTYCTRLWLQKNYPESYYECIHSVYRK